MTHAMLRAMKMSPMANGKMPEKEDSILPMVLYIYKV